MTTQTNVVWIGIGPGNVYSFPMTSREVVTAAGIVAGVDLTTIVTVSYNVYLPGATLPVSWSGVIVSATPPSGLQASTLMTHHPFAVVDCQVKGNYKVVPVLTDNLGTVFKGPGRYLVVVAEQDL
jgi:hypothetical protein